VRKTDVKYSLRFDRFASDAQRAVLFKKPAVKQRESAKNSFPDGPRRTKKE